MAPSRAPGSPCRRAAPRQSAVVGASPRSAALELYRPPPHPRGALCAPRRREAPQRAPRHRGQRVSGGGGRAASRLPVDAKTGTERMVRGGSNFQMEESGRSGTPGRDAVADPSRFLRACVPGTACAHAKDATSGPGCRCVHVTSRKWSCLWRDAARDKKTCFDDHRPVRHPERPHTHERACTRARRVTPAAVRERRPDPLRPRTSHGQPWPVPLYKEGPPSAEVHRRTHLAPIGVPCSSSLTLARTSRDPFEICHVRLR